MKQSQWEIVILKPTRLFLAFLESQLPDAELPDFNLLQADSTAYVIPQHEDDEDTLDEIEKHFVEMFHHEISRWLGAGAAKQVEGSFLDFLCCFKFEMHSQIVLMEPTLQEGVQLLCIKPRTMLLKWMRSNLESETAASDLLLRVNLSNLTENSTVVVKNFAELSQVMPFVQQYYRPIFMAEMMRMCNEAELWPEVLSYQDFNRYFTVEIHTQLVNLYQGVN